jgi:hypothetical protein
MKLFHSFIPVYLLIVLLQACLEESSTQVKVSGNLSFDLDLCFYQQDTSKQCIDMIDASHICIVIKTIDSNQIHLLTGSWQRDLGLSLNQNEIRNIRLNTGDAFQGALYFLKGNQNVCQDSASSPIQQNIIDMVDCNQTHSTWCGLKLTQSEITYRENRTLVQFTTPLNTCSIDTPIRECQEINCQNRIQDHGETGVDCGGICDVCTPQNNFPDMTSTIIADMEMNTRLDQDLTRDMFQPLTPDMLIEDMNIIMPIEDMNIIMPIDQELPMPPTCIPQDQDQDGCIAGVVQPVSADGPDTDRDGICDSGDADLDNDGRNNDVDTTPANANLCADDDRDACDDCARGSFNPRNDGDDLDGDGLCNIGDADLDNDGKTNDIDSNPTNPNQCSDDDRDTCEDCSRGGFNLRNDGDDVDLDGICNPADPDSDNDGVNDVNEKPAMEGCLQTEPQVCLSNSCTYCFEIPTGIDVVVVCLCD